MPVWKRWAGRAAVVLAIELVWVLVVGWAETAFSLDRGLHTFLQLPGLILAAWAARMLFPRPAQGTAE